MIWSIVACSMHSEFSSVGVSCSTMSDVSNNCGKYVWRWSTLNNGCRDQSYCPLQPCQWCMAHIRAGEGCNRLQRGTPSANVSKLCAYLELLQHSMLIMVLLALSISSVKNIMDLLADVLNVLNEVVIHADFRLDVRWIYQSSYKWYTHINGT